VASPYAWIREAEEVWPPTKLPFKATICLAPGDEYEVIVWPDWIERVTPEVIDPLWEPWMEDVDLDR
jgi:hypothetical protein